MATVLTVFSWRSASPSAARTTRTVCGDALQSALTVCVALAWRTIGARHCTPPRLRAHYQSALADHLAFRIISERHRFISRPAQAGAPVGFDAGCPGGAHFA